mgnify:CR=1 FL=1
MTVEYAEDDPGNEADLREWSIAADGGVVSAG